ncbi:IclR family transcriptional regulator [Streptomyces cavernicola]|uniref:IclR family transcriptional regulator n=1 Tax=Streptomyces cavernicola TaxID=3043613 RepID=A0ABT6SDZ8_9ACTN|nr:IclR family transcriptional regulator [Streptomyces sp. B-S-A6]MDI3406408.1 IclR family transcriptional regulator [Streptomyces sp. B-S-A6]
MQSVDRAVSILQVLAAQGPSGVTDIAEALEIHKSTVFRLLATLESRGLVEQASERGRYRIGGTVVELAGGATKGSDLSLLSRPICQELAAEVGETVNVAVHDGEAVVSVDQVIGNAAITSIDWVGKRTPVHATSAGKVFLAHLSQDQLAEFLTRPLEQFTPHTVTDPALLKEQLQTVRELGYSATSEEHEIGLAALSAPIRSLGGQVIAAVTLSGPTFRINDRTIPGLAERLVAAGDKISWRKGYIRRG